MYYVVKLNSHCQNCVTLFTMEDYEQSNFDSNYDNCTSLTHAELTYVALARGIAASVCFVLCFATFIFELIYMCRQEKTTKLQRLFLYLTFSTLLYVGMLSLHIEHFFRYEPSTQDKVCQAIGFLDQYTGSVQLMFTVGITIAIFNSLFKIMCTPYNAAWVKIKPTVKLKRRRVGFWIEIAFIIACFVLPAFFAWLPFILVPYGETGPWCWIKSLDKNCERKDEAFLEQLLLWYVPFGLVSAFSFVCVTFILLFFIYIRCRYSVMFTKVKEVAKEMFLLFSFLFVLCVLYVVEMVARTAVNLYKIGTFGMWLAYAIITPIGGIVIPISFFVYLLYNKFSSKDEPQEMVNHTNGKSDDAASIPDGFIHPRDYVSAASDTKDQERAFLTESTDVESSGKDTVTLPNGWEYYVKQSGGASEAVET